MNEVGFRSQRSTQRSQRTQRQLVFSAISAISALIVVLWSQCVFAQGPARDPSRCAPQMASAPFSVDASPSWNGWGNGVANTRFQPADQAGISAAQVPALKLKWAFAFPDTISAYTQPAVVGGRVFFGAMNGNVYALDAK